MRKTKEKNKQQELFGFDLNSSTEVPSKAPFISPIPHFLICEMDLGCHASVQQTRQWYM